MVVGHDSLIFGKFLGGVESRVTHLAFVKVLYYTTTFIHRQDFLRRLEKELSEQT